MVPPPTFPPFSIGVSWNQVRWRASLHKLNNSLVVVDAQNLARLTSGFGQVHWNPNGIYPPTGGLSGLGQDGTDLGGAWDSITSTIINDGQKAITSAINNAIATKSGATADPVPVQNRYTLTVLTPVSNALQMPSVVASAQALSSLYTFITSAETQWINFLKANWSTRSQAAQQTLAPYFAGLEQTIQADLAKLGAAPGTTQFIPGTNIPMPGSGSMSIGLLAIVAAWFLLRRK